MADQIVSGPVTTEMGNQARRVRDVSGRKAVARKPRKAVAAVSHDAPMRMGRHGRGS